MTTEHRALIRENANFLFQIYKSSSKYLRGHKLINATDENLDALICVVHYLCTGVIPIKKKLFPKIIKTRRFNWVKKTLQTLDLLSKNREQKVKFLKAIPFYEHILFNLFNGD